MNFKEAFERYKNGTASAEERAFVEEEIEKSELIFEYLEEKSTFDFCRQTASDNESQRVFTDIKKSLRKRNAKLVASAVAMMLSLALLYQFAIVPLGSMFFYNPSALITSYDENMGEKVKINTLAEASGAFFELHIPSARVTGAYAERTGLGTYEATIYTQNPFGGNETIARNIKYGTIEENLVGWAVLRNASVPYEIAKENTDRHTKNDEEWERMISALEALPTGLSVETSITFDTDLTAKELENLINKYKNIHIYWAGVDAGMTDTWLCSGFDPTYALVNDAPDADKFMEHFQKLLKTEIEHKDYLNMLDENYIDVSYYENLKKYVETNGLHIYGLVLKGSPEDIKSLLENENVIWAQIENVMFNVN